jgi:hypothetical protein
VVKRRSLDDALTPEEEAFLHPEKPTKATTTNVKPKSKPKQEKESPPMNRSAIQENFTPDTSPAINPTQFHSSGTSTVTARVDPQITSALLRASVDRRIKGQAPATHRDIIADALSAWLKKHGYLN